MGDGDGEKRPSTVTSALIGLGMGVGFGIVMEKSRMSTPSLIISQFLFEDFTMMRMFMSALAASATVIALLHVGCGVRLYPKPLRPSANILGGLIAGVGLAASGLCPGPLFAQVGAGRPEALYSLLGAVTGTVLFVYLQPAMSGFLSQGPSEPVQLHKKGGVRYWQAAAGVVVACGAALYAMHVLRGSWQTENIAQSALSLKDWALSSTQWSPYVCGLCIGLMQLPAFLLMKTFFGTSAAYVTACSHLCSVADHDLFKRNRYAANLRAGSVVTWEVLLHLGCFLGARLAAVSSGSYYQNSNMTLNGTQKIVTFVGSALLLFGMRMCGGCTSGHGISGIAQLSVGSLLTTACFFAGGIPAAFALRYMLQQ